MRWLGLSLVILCAACVSNESPTPDAAIVMPIDAPQATADAPLGTSDAPPALADAPLAAITDSSFPGRVDAAYPSDGGGAAFGALCATGMDCASGICFVGGSRSFCSIYCNGPSDCPDPPSDGTCNMMGYCRAP